MRQMCEKATKNLTVFMSACEPSADQHCAGLIRAINDKTANNKNLQVRFVGIGGPKMQSAGCEILDNTVEKAAMLNNAFSQTGQYIKRIRRISSYFKTAGVDLVIVCDSPAFNFHIAKAAKKSRIKTLFYVAPQLWAWAPWRIRKMRKYCDKLACVLPFEKQWFSSRGVDTSFVGNPMLDSLPFEVQDNIRDYSEFDPQQATIALLPGSRPAEIDQLWVPMQQIAGKLAAKWPGIKFIVPAVSEEKLEHLKQTRIGNIDFEYVIGDITGTCQRSDMAVIACGSVALQVAATGCPMIVIYQCSRFMWHILGRWLIKTRLYCLVNILAGKELIPEFMPYFTSIEPIFEKACRFLENKNQLQDLNRRLIELVIPVSAGNASENVADISLEMLE